MTYNKDDVFEYTYDVHTYNILLDISDRINTLYNKFENLTYIFNLLNYDKFMIYKDLQYIDDHKFDIIVFDDLLNNLKFKLIKYNMNNIIVKSDNPLTTIDGSLSLIDKLLNDFDIYVDIISNNTTHINHMNDLGGTLNQDMFNSILRNDSTKIHCDDGSIIEHIDIDDNTSVDFLVYTRSADPFLSLRQAFNPSVRDMGKVGIIIYSKNKNRIIYTICGCISLAITGLDYHRCIPLSFPEQVELFKESRPILTYMGGLLY